MSFRRALGPFDATMVVIGAIIGAGIFINPYIVAQRFGLAVGSVFVFRRRFPLRDRPPGTYATPGYLLLPALFVAAAVWIVASVILSNPVRSGLGVVLLATGVPAYLYWAKRKARGQGSA